MNRIGQLTMTGAALALAAMVGAKVPSVSAQEGTPAAKKPAGRAERMHGFVSAPLISIALRHKSELNLAGEQVANLEKIKSHYDSQVKPLQAQLSAIENEIAALMQQSPANLIQVKAKIQEGEKYRSELRYLRMEALENGRAVLTAQQQDQLKSLVRSRHENFRKHSSQPS
ncbi:MAG TPA: Spy/CpxP family protein refolding chaperone [Candidatus Binatia bacterium]|nr:Spy/CpxP family protein refolding chaperone [Candidatus Binatia bacterium]